MKSYNEQIDLANEGREDNEERKELMERYGQLKQRIAVNNNELEVCAKNDPERYKRIKAQLVDKAKKVSDITDDIMMIKKWMKNSNGNLDDN